MNHAGKLLAALFVVFVSLLADCNCSVGEAAAKAHEKHGEETLQSNREIKAYTNFCIAVDFMLLSQWEAAVESLERTLEYDPLSQKAHLYIASCHFQLEHDALAITHMETAARISPDDFDVHYTLGTILMSKGDSAKALEAFERAIGCESASDNAVLYGDALLNVAGLYLRQDAVDRAISCLNTIIGLELTSDPRQLYLEVGKLHYRAGNAEDSLEAFAVVKELDPSLIGIYPYMVACYEMLGRLDEAIAEADNFLSRSPNAWNMHLALSRVYRKKEDETLAAKHLQTAIDILGGSISLGSRRPDEYLVLGRLLLNQKDETRALAVVNGGLSFCEDAEIRKELYYLLSNIAYELSQLDKVELALKRVLDIDDNMHEANNFLGYLYVERGVNLDEAVVLIQKALDVQPENGAYLDSLGWAYYMMATLDDNGEMMRLALDNLHKAAGLMDDPEIQEHIGDLYYSLGKWEEAGEEWEKAMGFANDAPPVRRSGVRVFNRIKEKIERLNSLKNAEVG